MKLFPVWSLDKSCKYISKVSKVDIFLYQDKWTNNKMKYDNFEIRSDSFVHLYVCLKLKFLSNIL